MKTVRFMKASAATGQGLREIMWKAYEMLQKAPAEEEVIDIGKVDEADPDSFTILRDTEDADFEVKGKNIERLVAMTNFDNEEAVYRFQLIWRRLGIEKALKDMKKGKSASVLGFPERVQVQLVKHLPTSFVMKTWCKQQGK